MLGRIDAPDIVQRGHEPAERDEYLIVGVPVDLDPTRLETSVDLLVLVPEYVGVGVELVVILLPVLNFLLDLPVDSHGLQHIQFRQGTQLQFE